MPTFVGTSQAEVITGTDEDDLIDPRGGADVIDGRGGQDTIDFSWYNSAAFFFNQPLDITLRSDGVVQMIAQGYQRGGPYFDIPYGTAINVERWLIGTGVGLDLRGSSTPLTVISTSLYGAFIATGSGDDRITGGVGADTIRAGAGNNVIDAGAGDDVVHLEVSYAASTLSQANGLLTIRTGATTNEVRNAERIVFTDRPVDITPDGLLLVDVNRIEGNSGSDTLTGTAGVDALFGGLSADRLSGLDGDDFLFGGGGVDWLDGGAGDDRLYGGEGGDTFVAGSGRDLAWGEAGDDTFLLQLDLNAAASLVTFDGGAGADTLNLAGVASAASVILTGSQTGQIAVVATTAGGGSTEIARGQGVERLIGGDRSETFDFARHNAAVTIDAGGGADTILGSAFADVIRGGFGDDTINGGSGTDVAIYAGGVRAYSATSALVQGAEGRDALAGIEALRFADGTLTFDVDSQAAQVMRLYDTALNRRPDSAGFEANLDRIEQGRSLSDLARDFLMSPEFQQRFGGLDDTAFVQQLYRFSLDREADPGGLQAWVSALSAGASRADILVGFSESAEHRGLTAATLAEGLWVANDNAKIVARLYDVAFDRPPDSGGLASWTHKLDAGVSRFEVAAQFAASPEFQARTAGLTNAQFVQQLYRTALDREPSSAEVAGWAARLDNGTAQRWGLVSLFSDSAEYIALTQNRWVGGIPLLDSYASSALDVAKDDVPMVTLVEPLLGDAPLGGFDADWTPSGLAGPSDALLDWSLYA